MDSYFFFCCAQKKKYQKEKGAPGPYRSAGPGGSSTLLSFGAARRHGAVFKPILGRHAAFVLWSGWNASYWLSGPHLRQEKGAIRGSTVDLLSARIMKDDQRFPRSFYFDPFNSDTGGYVY